MKKYIIYILLLISASSTAQVKIGADGSMHPTGNYPTSVQRETKGYVLSVQSIVDRNAIPANFRDTGMIVAVRSDSSFYSLVGGVTNSNWVKLLQGGFSGSGIDSIFITSSDSIFIITTNNDTIYIGNSNQIRDTAKLTAGYLINMFDGNPYNPGGEDKTIAVDTLGIHNYMDSVIRTDTTISQTITTIDYVVDTVSNSPPVQPDGYKVLVGTSPTGAFVTHADQVATKVGGVYTYVTATTNQSLEVRNQTQLFFYKKTDFGWIRVSVADLIGGITGIDQPDIGTIDSNSFTIKTKNIPAITVDANQNIYNQKYIGLEDSAVFYRPGLNGLFDIGHFRHFEPGTNVTFTNSNDTTFINSTGGGLGTWQQTLDNGSDLNKNNYSDFTDHAFTMQGGATIFSLNSITGTESAWLNAGGSGGSAYFFLKGYDGGEGHGWDLKGFANSISVDTPSVEFSSNAETRKLFFKGDSISINDAYFLPPTDGASGQVLTTNGLGSVTWQDGGGGGGSSLFPTPSGTGTATGNVTGELGGNRLTVNNGANTFLDINTASGSEGSILQSIGGTGSGSFGVYSGTGSGYLFGLDVTDGTNDINIIGDAPTNTITHTAGTHLFNGNTVFANNGTPALGKVPTGTDGAGNWTWQSASGGGTTTNALTFNNGGSGDASGTTFNGSAARTLSYNSIGAVPTTRTVNSKALSSNITLGLASSDFANQGTTTTVLHGNASGNPSFSAVSLTADVSGILPVANGGTGTSSPGITAGTNISVTGTFPTQAVATVASPSFTQVSATRPLTFSGTTPSFTLGTGAGTGASASITGNDAAGYITLATGTTPTAGGDILTVTFATALTNTPTSITLTPGGGFAALHIAKYYVQQSSASSTSWKIIDVGGAALPAGTTFIFYYHITQ